MEFTLYSMDNPKIDSVAVVCSSNKMIDDEEILKLKCTDNFTNNIDLESITEGMPKLI